MEMHKGCSTIYLKPFAAWGCKEASPVGKQDGEIWLLVPFSLQRVGWRLSNQLVEPLSIWSLIFQSGGNTSTYAKAQPENTQKPSELLV